ncbi:tRNA 5-carboxymethoxyuridine methyltransferase [Alishewanella longhuensis]|uniref:tRNA 5-carboxymethoxyuridine methyltransferase n=1 Tax=Alishewanella longhuensis TaxID=1091037 RepID=A0ABQ3KZE9_9ALTE|nr:methyltransferase domain-containing protein [Alishewanella longhuensis]GHG71720.1 tRNA 5-carboxymethoxyuridine methyltransferase [Alishewanella longhuensis]
MRDGLTDRNFDSLAGRFSQNIYNTTKGKIRQAVLMRDLLELPQLARPSALLDVGGGQGQLALQLAALGHQVVLNDISGEMLQIAKTEALAQGLLAQLSFIQSPLQQLHEQLAGKNYPLVLCHAVLEWLADPQAAITALKQWVAPGGVLSLMFYNKEAHRFSNILYGNFDYVNADMRVKKPVRLNPQHPLVSNEVLDWCRQAGFSLLGKTGVRCFHDYLRDREQQQSHYTELEALELQYNRQEPYASLGRYTHLLLRAEPI